MLYHVPSGSKSAGIRVRDRVMLLVIAQIRDLPPFATRQHLEHDVIDMQQTMRTAPSRGDCIKVVAHECDIRDAAEGIPELADIFWLFVARKGIYFVSAAKPTVLEYFDFAMDKSIVGNFWVSNDDRYALLPQLSDYHQNLMLAEPKR
jgi:hypothetical protein